MQKLTISLAFAFAFGMNVMAQTSDGFFHEYNVSRSEEDYAFPFEHFSQNSGFYFNDIQNHDDGIGFNNFDFSNAPLGSGVLLLATMGAAYCLRKKSKSKINLK